MLQLVRAELLKLGRRPLALMSLAAFLITLLISRSLELLVIGLADGMLGDMRVQVLSEELLSHYRRQLAFPGIFGATLSSVNGLGAIIAIVLAAATMGSEYGWGTLRTQLARRPGRGALLAAKIVALLVLLLAGILIGLLFSAALAAGFGAVLGRFGAVTPADLLAVPLGVLRSLYIMLPYILLTIAFSIIGRSVLAGVAGGLLYLSVEVSLGAYTVFGGQGGLLGLIYNLTIQPNITTLVFQNAQAFGLDPGVAVGRLDVQTLPPVLQAVLVIALYSMAFVTVAYTVLRRRDITGAA